MSTDQSSKLRLTDALVLEKLDQNLLSSSRTECFGQKVIRCGSAGILAADNLQSLLVSFSIYKDLVNHTVWTFGPPGQLTIATLAAN
jgi:hypothetical protein